MESIPRTRSARRRNAWTAALYSAGIALISAPFLTPCAYGVLQLPVRGVAALTSGRKPIEKSTTPDTPRLVVRQGVSLPRNLTITEAQLAGGRCRDDGGALHFAGKVFGNTLMVTAVAIDWSLAENASALGQPEISRGRLTVLEVPEVVLSGVKICRLEDKRQPHGVALARVEGDAKISVTDSKGSYFALARRIHYRAASKTALLEDGVIIRCGGQTITSDLVRLDIAGRAVEGGHLRVTTTPE